MVDSCVITRTTVTGTDPDTGQQTTSTSTIYSGKCEIQQAEASASPSDVGEAAVYQQPSILKLPVMTSAGVNNRDVVTITTSANDPDLAGRKFWLKALAHKTYATARRFGISEVTS